MVFTKCARPVGSSHKLDLIREGVILPDLYEEGIETRELKLGNEGELDEDEGLASLAH